VPPRLVTIPISHFGERARWALDHAGVDYDETHTLQFFSWIPARRIGGRKTLPVLVTERGVLTDSADIVRWASARAAAPLYPVSPAARREVEAFEDALAARYAVETRRVAYQMFFRCLDAFLPYNAGRAPPWQVASFRAARRPMRAFARGYLALGNEALGAAQDETDRTMDRIAERLRDGRRYVDGETLGAADIAFAAFSAAVLVPERYPVALPTLDEIPRDLANAIRARRRHPAGAFAMRLYDERVTPRGRYERPLFVRASS
jgi:glutathione S-transferase